MAAAGFCFQGLVFIFSQIAVSWAKTSQDCFMPEGEFCFGFFWKLDQMLYSQVFRTRRRKEKGCGFFYSKNSCNFIWACFIVSAAKRSTAKKMFDRLVAFTEDITRFWKSYLVTQGILCTRSPVSALAPLMIPLPNSILREGCSLSQSFWLRLF